tara:strand:- start:33 stop:347 length:315 start_codon:yes stop_codon:yes gene_type:complete
MTKLTVFALILFLIIGTSIIKNSTKDLDYEIYSINENILFLENRLKDTKLDFDYLSSSEKLLELQKIHFEDSLVKKTINEFKILELKDNQFEINDLSLSGKAND